MRKAFLLAAMLSAVCAAPLAAAELNVLTAGAVVEAEKALAADYTKETGTAVRFTNGTVGQIQEKLKAGAAADVIVLSAPALEQLEKSGAVSPSSAVALGRIGIGVGVRAGAALPDISTPDKFKDAMLKAKSITYMDPAAGASSGIATAKVMKDLGIADAMGAKTKLTETGYSADRVASGEVEFAIQNISEIVPVKGVALAGPLPGPLQTTTAYAAGVAASSTAPKEAADFIRYLARPESALRWKAAGIDPAH